jgi:hypothetical protein
VLLSLVRLIGVREVVAFALGALSSTAPSGEELGLSKEKDSLSEITAYISDRN